MPAPSASGYRRSAECAGDRIKLCLLDLFGEQFGIGHALAQALKGGIAAGQWFEMPAHPPQRLDNIARPRGGDVRDAGKIVRLNCRAAQAEPRREQHDIDVESELILQGETFRRDVRAA